MVSARLLADETFLIEFGQMYLVTKTSSPNGSLALAASYFNPTTHETFMQVYRHPSDCFSAILTPAHRTEFIVRQMIKSDLSRDSEMFAHLESLG